jgi:hypothetical protein
MTKPSNRFKLSNAGGDRLAFTLIPIAFVISTIVFAACSSSNSSVAYPGPFAAPNDSLSKNIHVVQALDNSCFGCHSSAATLPWNAKLAPSYIFGADDARKTLNFSAWDSYDTARRRAAMAEIAKVVEDGSMPPWDFRVLHPSGALSNDQRQIVLDWASGGADKGAK